MNPFNLALYFIAGVIALVWGLQARARGSKVGVLLAVSFFVRCTLGLIIDSSLKYRLVVDDMIYEQEGWEVARRWLFPGAINFTADGDFAPNAYKYVIACFYYVFGNRPIVPIFFNAACGAISGYFAYLISNRFVRKVFRAEEFPDASLLAPLLVTLYPSFMIWSAVNIRDPFYILLCLLSLLMFLRINDATPIWPRKISSALVLTAALFSIHALRGYAVLILVGGMLAGLAARGLKAGLKPRAVFGLIPFTALIAGVLAAQAIWPDFISLALTEIQKMRDGLANIGYDGVAQSAFSIDYVFDSAWKAIAFLPIALGYYFFAPFPWTITTGLQMVSLPEVFLIYALTWPTVRGVRLALSRARAETLLIGYVVLVMAVAQAVVVSNVGTIVRHRTLSLILLFIFTGIGIYDWKKEKSSENLLTA